MKEVVIYTDGECWPNPGIGGWGCILKYGSVSKELYGGEISTTNNRMEMLAAIYALNALKESCKVTLYTDSLYLINGITKWHKKWQKDDWHTRKKRKRYPVKNVDLWKKLIHACERHQVEWVWVKGHSGNEGNERADYLAGRGREIAAA